MFTTLITINVCTRYKCEIFGQDFQRQNGSFYSEFETTCKADKKWSVQTMPDSCKCKLKIIC